MSKNHPLRPVVSQPKRPTLLGAMVLAAAINLFSISCAHADDNPLNWDEVLGLTVTVEEDACEDGDYYGNPSESAPLTGGVEGCPYKLAVTVTGSVETQDSGYDFVYVNGVLFFSSDGEDGGCNMAVKTETKEIEVYSGDEITISYDTVDGAWHSGAYATITKIELVEEGCESGCSPGAGSTSNGSVHVRFNMGRTDFGQSAGAISIIEQTPSPDLGTTASLRYSSAWDGVEVIRDGQDDLRQVKAPQALADVIEETASRFRVDYYVPGQIGPLTNGLYDQQGMTPFVSWVVENLDPVNNDHLTITEVLGSKSRVSEYVWHPTEQGWELITGNGQRKVLKTRDYDNTNDTLTVTEVVRNAGNTVVSKTVNVYKDFPWGRELIETILDPDGVAITTTRAYYDDPVADGASYRKAKSVVGPHGAWRRYEYDSAGRRSKTVEPFLDGAPGAAESQSKVTTVTHQDYEPQETTVVTILGQEVERRYKVNTSSTSHLTQTIVCTAAGASYSAASNLVTERSLVGYGEFTGDLAAVIYPDGTQETYSYFTSGGSKTTLVQRWGTGAAGTETSTTIDVAGNLLSQTETDITSGLVLTSKTATTQDDFGRATRIDYNDGTYELFSYGCCGMESRRDRDGIVTTYSYDDLKRMESETRAGITMIYGYDADGRLVTRTRVGSGSGAIVDETNTFDLAGRLTSRTNALNQTTSYSETTDGNGREVRTTTLPDNSTRVETSHRDGRTYTVAGTAARPLKYEYGATGSGGRWTKEIRIGTGGVETEWVETFVDLAGRTVRVRYPDNAEETREYNSLGQLIKQTDPDGVVRLYSYDTLGELSEEAIDTDASGTISGGDLRSKTSRTVVSGGSNGTLLRTTMEEGTSSGYTTVAVTDVSPNGRYRKSTQHGLETISSVTLDGNGGSTEAVSHPDGSVTTNVYDDGRIVSRQTQAGGATVQSTTFSYDGYGRLAEQIDARVGTVTAYTYDDADQLEEVDVGGMVTGYG